ncbi:MAG: aldehyde dehydrogenase family protein [bacterium]
MVSRFGLWINGNSVETQQWDTIMDPYLGKPFAEVAVAGEPELEQAIQGAQHAFETLRSLSRGERADMLYAISALVKTHRDDLAHWLVQESGKPIDASLLELDRVATTFRLSAEEALRDVGEVQAVDLSARNKNFRALYERFPIGPISAITPFNFPLNLSAHKIGPAFAAGNPVVLKPPVQCPAILIHFARIIQQAGVPDGALNVIHCHPPVAERLATDDRFKLLSFTGSARVGWHLKSIAGRKRVLLELGGNAGAIVHQDADLAHAARRLALGAYFQAGQVCIKPQRIYVHKSIAQLFQQAFVNETRALPVGNPANPGTVIGPMIDESAAQRVMDWVQEAIDQGAQVLLEGKREGRVVPPYVLTQVPENLKVVCEEVFGPVTIIESCNDFDEALQKVNQSRYGLQAAVFTHDIRLIDQAFRTLQVGGVICNDYPNFRTDNFPYGGSRDSGMGREGVRYAMDEMTEKRMLVINMNA